MKNAHYAIAAFVCFSLAAGSALGQTKDGNVEFGLHGSLMQEGDDILRVNMVGDIGYFLSQSLEAGFSFQVSGIFLDTNSGVMYLLPYLRTHSSGEGKTVVPFFGVGVGGGLANDDLMDGLVVNPHAGFKLFASEQVSYNLSLESPILMNEDQKFERFTLVLMFGASMYY